MSLIRPSRSLSRSYRFDFDELVSIAENRDAKQRARRVVIAEVSTDDLPRGNEVIAVVCGDVDRRRQNVAELRASSTQSDREIRHDPLRLTRDVPNSDDVPGGVERTGARREDQTTRFMGDRSIGIRHVVTEIVRTDKLHGRPALHDISLAGRQQTCFASVR